MKKIKLIIASVLCVLALSQGIMSLAQDKGDNKTRFSTPEEAAMAAKQHMMQAMEQVNFGVSKDKLERTTAGPVATQYLINWDALLKADNNARPEDMTQAGNIDIVPLVIDKEVVTVISLKGKDGGYAIGGIGDKRISYELDMVRHIEPEAIKGGVNIYEVPNLDANIYAVSSSGKYYTSYKSSIRKAQSASDIMQLLLDDARNFERKYGEQLRKEGLLK